MKCHEFDLLIEPYLTGQLDQTKQEDFELHYFTCQKCFISLKIENLLRQKQFTISLLEKKVFFIPKMAWAASLLLISIMSIFYFFNPLDIFKNKPLPFAVEVPYFITSENRQFQTHTIFLQAMSHYNQKDYQQALHLLNQIREDPFHPAKIFFSGICHLKLNQYRRAIKKFNLIISKMDPSYFDETLYYKSIALIGLHKKQEAIKILKNLSSMFSPYANKAEELIKRI